MDRRQFIRSSALGVLGLGACSQLGCRSGQTAQVVKPGEKTMVGSNTAGGETYGPLVDGAVSNLLGRHCGGVQPAAYTQGTPANGSMRICFLGVENKSIEELGDFRETLYEQIDQRILNSGNFQSISKRSVDAGLQAANLRPEEVLLPQNMRILTERMEQMQQPFDFVLIAKITSGTTRSNADYQREYLLTLEMLNVHNGTYAKESATIVKKYNVSTWSKMKSLTPWG
ncbi:MAG: penicillin-binding protein activator LpoB [Planctomycetota bacterium]